MTIFVDFVILKRSIFGGSKRIVVQYVPIEFPDGTNLAIPHHEQLRIDALVAEVAAEGAIRLARAACID
jgi:hypothetical protein